MKRGKYVLINSNSDSSVFFTKVWAVEKENNASIAIAPNQFFSQFASWKRNHNKCSLKEFVESEFVIWYIYLFIRRF